MCQCMWFGDVPARNSHIIGIEIPHIIGIGMASVALPDLFSSEICSLRAYAYLCGPVNLSLKVQYELVIAVAP